MLIRWAPTEHLLREPAEPVAPARRLRRFAVPSRGMAFWASLWTAAVVAEALALRPLLDQPGAVPWLAVVFSLAGGSFAACGLIAWHRRPDSHSGVLMTATGFAFFLLPLLGQIDSPVAVTAALLFVDVWTILFVWLLLTLVTGGRLESRLDRLLVFAFVLPLLILEVVWALFAEEEEGNLLFAISSPGIEQAIDTTQRSILIAACFGTAIVLVVRWWAASGPRRRALLPTLAGAFVLVVYTALLVNDVVTGERSETLLWIASCSLLTVPIAFLAGLLRSRLARSGLTGLFRDLRFMRGEELQRALARALGDPGLVVAYAGADGSLPAAAPDRSVRRVGREGDTVAALMYDPSLDDDPELVEAVAAAASIALEHERMQTEAQVQLAELQASRERIVAAGDAERRRLERDLHDGAQQRLVALALQLRLIQADIRRDPTAAEALVVNASGQLAESLKELRDLARGIHPAGLDRGLPVALESLAVRSTVPTVVTCDVPERLPEPLELGIYFVACEGLANVSKYANATAASVRLMRTSRGVAVEIADDGVGGADPAAGSGLRGLRDRVETLGGHLIITSPVGAGTVLTAELPCAS